MQPPRYDPLIAGGRVLDPGQGIDALTDVAVAGDRIVLIEKAIDGTRARRVLDATGLLVVPGLVELLTHVAAGLGSLPTDPPAVTPEKSPERASVAAASRRRPAASSPLKRASPVR